MNQSQLRVKIAEHLELIKYTNKSSVEALERATKFLIMVALLADEKRNCEEDKARLTTIVDASFADAKDLSESKNITEKKMDAARNKGYTDFREALEDCEAKISWIKTYIDIFNNAHITYRTLAKE